MRRDQYRTVGYTLLLLYLLLVGAQALHLYQLANPDWHAGDWLALIVFLLLLPGLPGFLLIVPSKVLPTWVAFPCQVLGITGNVLAVVWGFIFSPQWWLIPVLAIPLNLVARQVYSSRREII